MRPNITALTHDHIDGSIAMKDVILDLYEMAGKQFPFATPDEWIRYFADPHRDIVRKFGTVTGVLQTADALETAGFAYGRRRAQEGILYAEAKFAPQYSLAQGLTLQQAVHAMYKGLKRAESAFGIRILPVIAIGREADEGLGRAIARVALEYDGEVALDLACDEAGFPPQRHLPAYRLTFGSRVRRDCHAGEWVAKEPAATYRERLLKNVRYAVDELRCHGVGHAIPLIHDQELLRRVVGDGIRIAGCPYSNLMTGAIGDVRELGIDRLLDAGVIYTLNADDDLLFPGIDAVSRLTADAYGFSERQCRLLEANAYRGALAYWRDLRRD